MKKIVITFAAILVVLPMVAEVTYLTSAEFKTKIMDYSVEKEWKYVGKKPCVIDFYTTWCGPCKRLAPIMDELSEKYKGKVIFYKADTERERDLAYVFQINSIPQVLYIPVEGQPILLKGLYPKEDIIKIIDTELLKKKK
ncbi:MAG: thioredoxin domain-containing protein [Paludibacteraceae bacterium]|nr:thioredoxin domain-containing protein [Paludibacteraceae bacterium]